MTSIANHEAIWEISRMNLYQRVSDIENIPNEQAALVIIIYIHHSLSIENLRRQLFESLKNAEIMIYNMAKFT